MHSKNNQTIIYVLVTVALNWVWYFYNESFFTRRKMSPTTQMELCPYRYGTEASEFLWGVWRRFLKLKSHVSFAIHADADPNPALHF
jgi:hypothetical protein